MFSCRFYLFCMVNVLCIYLCFGSSPAKKCLEVDKKALLKFRDGLASGNQLMSLWNGEDCCKWKGISCNNLTGHVIRLELPVSDYFGALQGKLHSSICELQHLSFLDLSGNYLEGEIPKCIGELQHLSFLYLSGNSLEGEIPKCIGSLGQLIELKLANTGLSGSVPYTVANLTNLQNLDLADNNLVANDLEWLSHLSNLRYLDLSSFNLYRCIDLPSSISKIPHLLELYLDGCWLPYVNPKSIAHVNSSSSSLQILSVYSSAINPLILSWVLNSTKVLTYLDLSINYLHSVPDGLANMISLKHLDLSNNRLGGSVMEFFEILSQLKNLESLDLYNNPFSRGPLPDFSRLSSLKHLNLCITNIAGPLSSGHLPHLEYLNLCLNNLSGPLPIFEVTKFASLSFLDLSNNQLSGIVSNTIGQLSNLSSLSLASNKLNGNISEGHLLHLPRMEILDVSGNSLHFNLSPNWVPPFQLRQLYASSCTLGSQFPMWLKHHRNLLVLQISNTGIIDSIPEWFWNMSSSLTYLNVSQNKLSGALSKSLPSIKLDYRSAWDFSFNNLSGLLPPLPEQYALEALFLSNNMFSGSVSFFCPKLPVYLTFLDLSSNLLVGPIPNCWEKFPSLRVLNLANNSLSGRIPESFGTLREIESIHLNNNHLSGEIPSLTLCRSLKLIDFGDNILEGTLPTWVGHNLQHLIVLSLQGNKIQGTIPTSLCNLSSLQVLDLSINSITGKIPQCFNHITSLSDMTVSREIIFYHTFLPNYFDETTSASVVDKTTLAWKGESREYGKNLGLMTIIDLSSNHLTGEIPQSITSLVALAGLNLSGNNLTGFIPNNIGDMQMLESLDLSRNHLYGRMPTSFSNLSFLSYMNLSFNNLSGKIPMGTQLQSFDPSAYVGNIGLCGQPLTKQCPDDVVPPIIGRVEKKDIAEDEDKLISFGFYISLGLGFCVGFWGVCGTLIIKSSWRHAYFQFFKDMSDWTRVTIIVFTARMKRRFQIQD